MLTVASPQICAAIGRASAITSARSAALRTIGAPGVGFAAPYRCTAAMATVMWPSRRTLSPDPALSARRLTVESCLQFCFTQVTARAALSCWVMLMLLGPCVSNKEPHNAMPKVRPGPAPTERVCVATAQVSLVYERRQEVSLVCSARSHWCDWYGSIACVDDTRWDVP